jgi:cell division GTPase FtsZ
MFSMPVCSGAGGNPEQGRLAAEESQAELSQITEGADMVRANGCKCLS